MESSDRSAKESIELLLLSNSTLKGEGFLEFAGKEIQQFLGKKNNLAFVPFAAVTFSYDQYIQRVRETLKPHGYQVTSVHEVEDPAALIKASGGILVGGGNSFHLLKQLYRSQLLGPIHQAVSEGTPYIGWSAGSNVACPTIMTTNDMPIVQPESFKALDLVEFQINPHFTDKVIPDHGGETRRDRIAEFIQVNPKFKVLALPEGTMVVHREGRFEFRGLYPGWIFGHGEDAREVNPNSDITNYLR